MTDPQTALAENADQEKLLIDFCNYVYQAVERMEKPFIMNPERVEKFLSQLLSQFLKQSPNYYCKRLPGRTLGERIKLLMELYHYSPTYVSTATGMSCANVTPIIRNKTFPQMRTLRNLAELFQVSVSDLLSNLEFPDHLYA